MEKSLLAIILLAVTVCSASAPTPEVTNHASDVEMCKAILMLNTKSETLLPALLLLLSPVTPAVTDRPDLVCSLCRTVMELLDQAITDTTNEQAVAEFLAQVGHFV